MKVEVDSALCQGHARCAFEAPELFDLDDDGHATVTQPDVASDLVAAAKRAEMACPERAIRLS